MFRWMEHRPSDLSNRAHTSGRTHPKSKDSRKPVTSKCSRRCCGIRRASPTSFSPQRESRALSLRGSAYGERETPGVDKAHPPLALAPRPCLGNRSPLKEQKGSGFPLRRERREAGAVIGLGGTIGAGTGRQCPRRAAPLPGRPRSSHWSPQRRPPAIHPLPKALPRRPPAIRPKALPRRPRAIRPLPKAATETTGNSSSSEDSATETTGNSSSSEGSATETTGNSSSSEGSATATCPCSCRVIFTRGFSWSR